MSYAPNVYLYKRIVQAKLFIDAHYAENIDLSTISDEAHFSKFHFIRLFKSIYGKTPHQYLTAVRIERAKTLLQQGSSVGDACARVGFESPTSFAALFRRSTQISPLAYQQRCMARSKELRRMPLKFIPGCFASQHGWTNNRNFEEA